MARTFAQEAERLKRVGRALTGGTEVEFSVLYRSVDEIKLVNNKEVVERHLRYVASIENYYDRGMIYLDPERAPTPEAAVAQLINQIISSSQRAVASAEERARAARDRLANVLKEAETP